MVCVLLCAYNAYILLFYKKITQTKFATDSKQILFCALLMIVFLFLGFLVVLFVFQDANWQTNHCGTEK